MILGKRFRFGNKVFEVQLVLAVYVVCGLEKVRAENSSLVMTSLGQVN